MKFEHIVEINDLLDPLSDMITRDQLWRGLVLRAQQPQIFIPYLDNAIISDQHSHGMERELHFGDLVVRDKVIFIDQQSVIYNVYAQENMPESSLEMRIEEPQAGSLFVRFIYDNESIVEDDEEVKMMNEYRKSAYQEADIDTIRIIRELIETGRLNLQ